jgi:hypothetical protein
MYSPGRIHVERKMSQANKSGELYFISGLQCSPDSHETDTGVPSGTNLRIPVMGLLPFHHFHQQTNPESSTIIYNYRAIVALLLTG